MTSGVSLYSRSAAATWGAVTGAWSTDYPVSNLGDLIFISKVARVTPAGGVVAFTFNLGAVQTIQFLSLVNHTILAPATMRVRLFSDLNPDPVGNAAAIVYDSAATAVWPTGGPVASYPSQRPLRVSAAGLAVGSGRIDLAAVSGPIDIGGLEVSQFWAWDLSPGKDFGFDSRDPSLQLATGPADGTDGWLPRVLSGQIDFLRLAEASTTGLDFQSTQGLAKPFMFVENLEDASTWARGAMLARNITTPLSSGVRTRHDKFQFRLREHWR